MSVPITSLRAPGTVLIAVISLGCGQEELDRPLTSTRDSAGWAITESSAPAWQGTEGWSIASAPLVDLQRFERGELFGISDAVRLSNGDLVVAAGRDLLRLSSRGELLAKAGGDGQGPGEFGSPPQLEMLADDSIVAFDFRLQRITLLGPVLETRKVVQLPSRLYAASLATVPGHFVVMGAASLGGGSSEEGLVRRPVPILAISRDGRRTDTVAFAAGSELVQIRVGDEMLIERPPFGRESFYDAGLDGIVVGDALALEYRRYGIDGQGLAVSRGFVDLEATPEAVSAERESMLGSDPPPRLARIVDQMLKVAPRPLQTPAYSNIVVDATGAVWLREYPSPSSDREGPSIPWQVFTADGMWLGPVLVPSRFEVFEIGRDFLLGVHRDDLGNERLQVLRLIRD